MITLFMMQKFYANYTEILRYIYNGIKKRPLRCKSFLFRKLIQSFDKGDLSRGTYFIPLNLNSVSAGIYVVKLKAGNRSYTKIASK
jgi:hypothetical protein